MNDVARPMSSPNGMSVALAPSKVSDNDLPPSSNSIRPAPVASPYSADFMSVSLSFIIFPPN